MTSPFLELSLSVATALRTSNPVDFFAWFVFIDAEGENGFAISKSNGSIQIIDLDEYAAGRIPFRAASESEIRRVEQLLENPSSLEIWVPLSHDSVVSVARRALELLRK